MDNISWIREVKGRGECAMRSGQEILAVLQAHKDVFQHRFPAEKGTGQYAVDTLELAGASPAPGAGSAPG
jgi:hypothetical protein